MFASMTCRKDLTSIESQPAAKQPAHRNNLRYVVLSQSILQLASS